MDEWINQSIAEFTLKQAKLQDRLVLSASFLFQVISSEIFMSGNDDGGEEADLFMAGRNIISFNILQISRRCKIS